MSQHPPTTRERTNSQRGLAFVKLMRANGFAVVDVVAERSLGTVGEGRHPHGLAFHPSGQWAYLAYASSGTVEVLDTNTLEIVNRFVDVGTAPIGIACTRDGRYIFVTAYGDLPGTENPGLSILRTNARLSGELSTVDHRPIGKCAGIVVDASNDLWVAMKDDDELLRIANPSFNISDRFSLPGDPQDLAYAPGYGLLGVNNVEDGSVSFVDVRTPEVLGTVPAPNPRGGAVSPSTDRWFVADTNGDGLTVVDVAGETPTLVDHISLATPTAFADVAPGGDYLVVDAYDDDRVAFVDTHTLSVIARVQTGPTPRHPRFSADGQRCYVPSVDDDTFTILDTSGLVDDKKPTVREQIDLPDDSSPSSCFLTERAGRGSYT